MLDFIFHIFSCVRISTLEVQPVVGLNNFCSGKKFIAVFRKRYVCRFRHIFIPSPGKWSVAACEIRSKKFGRMWIIHRGRLWAIFSVPERCELNRYKNVKSLSIWKSHGWYRKLPASSMRSVSSGELSIEASNEVYLHLKYFYYSLIAEQKWFLHIL